MTTSVSVARSLARVSGAAIAAVPTLDVIAENVATGHGRIAVCLNAKRGQCFNGVYNRIDNAWQRVIEPSLMTPEQIAGHGPDAVVGDEHAVDRLQWPASIERLPPELAVPRSRVVWEIGRAMVASGRTTDAYTLTPLYVRLPEAEELWRKNQTELEAQR